MWNSFTVQKQRKNKKAGGQWDKVELDVENGKDRIKRELQKAVEAKEVKNRL